MSLDLTVLRLLKYRDKYEAVSKNVPPQAVQTHTRIILDDFGVFFREFGVGKIDADPFMVWFKGFRHPTLKPEAVSVFEQVMKDSMADVDPAIELGLMERLIAADVASRVADLISKWNEGGEVDLYAAMRDTVERFEQQLGRKVKNSQILDPIEDLLKEEENDTGLHWRLGCINRHIKPLRGGDFVVVAGRPDKGKTTFCASELTFMAAQVDAMYPDEKRSILWFNNEGPGRRIVTRCFQSALNATTEDLVALSQAGTIRSKYAEAMGGRGGTLRIFDIHGMRNDEVEDVMRKFRPAAVLFDMVDNIEFGGGTINNGQRTDQLLEGMYQWARMMGVKYDCPVIATSQLSADADGLQFPTLPMLKDSKCFSPDTQVRMSDGTVRRIDSIQIGEKVMGTDGTPRNVIGTGCGVEPMFRVSGKGWYFDCNESHNLVVQNPTTKVTAGLKKGEVRDISLRDFMAHPSYRQRLAAVRCRIPYHEKALPMDPYLFGLWLGDGASSSCRITSGDREILDYLEGLPTYRYTYSDARNCSDVYFGPRAWLDGMGVRNNKHIPHFYKTASIDQRLALLAGLMDSDGTIDHGSSVIAMTNKRVGLVDDIADVARSLGYRVSTRHKASNSSYAVTFAPTDRLPCLLDRKVHVCSPRADSMRVKPIGVGRYVGITVDGDSRYCHAAYVALRNTGKQGSADVIITIGASNDPVLAKSRYIGTTKNKKVRSKMPASPNMEVFFDGDRGRYVEEQA